MNHKVLAELNKIANLLDNEWITVDQMRTICASCADKMQQKNISRVRASIMVKNIKKAYGWSSLPKGWTQASAEKFWSSLTGDVKHKVSKCIRKMEGHFDDAGAFCASLADLVEGTDWRHEPRS